MKAFYAETNGYDCVIVPLTGQVYRSLDAKDLEVFLSSDPDFANWLGGDGVNDSLQDLDSEDYDTIAEWFDPEIIIAERDDETGGLVIHDREAWDKRLEQLGMK